MPRALACGAEENEQQAVLGLARMLTVARAALLLLILYCAFRGWAGTLVSSR